MQMWILEFLTVKKLWHVTSENCLFIWDGRNKIPQVVPFFHANQDIHIQIAQALADEGKEGEKTRKENI